MILSHYCLIWFILEARAELQKYFSRFLVQIKTLKFASEINWPLYRTNSELRQEKLLVVGIWGFVELVFAFPFRTALFICVACNWRDLRMLFSPNSWAYILLVNPEPSEGLKIRRVAISNTKSFDGTGFSSNYIKIWGIKGLLVPPVLQSDALADTTLQRKYVRLR
jgi:hypothetical protein